MYNYTGFYAKNVYSLLVYQCVYIEKVLYITNNSLEKIYKYNIYNIKSIAINRGKLGLF